MNQEMPQIYTRSINSLKPKAQLTQSLMSFLQPLRASGSLHLSGLYGLLIRLLGAIIPKIKNALLVPLGESAASSRLLKIEGSYSSLALNAFGLKTTQSFFAFFQEAKQPILPFDLQKQNKPRAGIALGDIVPEA